MLRPGCGLRLIGGLLAVALRMGGAQGALAAEPPADGRVVALLGKPKDTELAQRAEIGNLWAHRTTWAGAPLSRLLVYRRLSQNYRRLHQPDSEYVCLLRARREVRVPAVGRQYPHEVASVWELLASYHWSVFQLDSTAHYYEAAAAQLVAGGFDLTSRKDVRLADGSTDNIGRAVASRYANAGLVYRRQGELATATRLYEQALKLLQVQQAPSGLCWVLCLLGEAYEDQGNDARAWVYYQQAFGVVREIARVNPQEAAGEWVDVLDYSHDLLLRQGKVVPYGALVREALPLMHRMERLSPTLDAAPEHTGAIYLHQATLYLRTQPPDSVRAALARAAAARVRNRQLSVNGLSDEYFNRGLIGLCLEIRLAHRTGDEAAQHRWEQAALTALREIPTAQRQTVARARLGECLAEVGNYGLAVRVLRPLVGPYRAQGMRLKLREVYQQLERASVGRGLIDSAYYYAKRIQQLSDTLRAAGQYAALAAVETRYRTREQARHIGLLTERAAQQRRAQQRAWLGALLLGLLLAGTAWALRYTRRLNRRLAALDQLKSQFFANVSHELRTPLTLIVGPVAQLLEQPEGLSVAARRQLDLTLRNGQRLQQLVNGLLDLTKLEAGKLQLHLAPDRLGPRLRQVVDSFEALAGYQQIGLTLDNPLPADLTLRLDAAKLEQILSNLLSNALKFTSAGGQVRLEARAAGAGQWRLTVRDTGPGIASDEQEKVFERFYQTRQRHAQGGTGIGLTLSRELAQLMGGSLTLQSEVGQGSAFTLTFPAEELAVGARGEERGAEVGEDELPTDDLLMPDGARPRVLVVEDYADLRAYLRQILAPRYDVLEAENGQQALEMLAQERVDLISSDEMMPLMSGTELLLSLKGQAQWRRVPFLMLTARADVQHRFRALELGVDDYLQKPFAPRELLARIHNLLTNYRERMAFARSEERGARSEGEGERLEVRGEKFEDEERVVAAVDDELLQRLRAIAEGALADPAFDVLQLGIQLQMSERTLYRRLKEQTGLTPAAYLREVRLEHARYLLETRATATVAEVAYAVGFEDPSYFGKVFVKRYGKRPGEYLMKNEE